MGTDIWPLCTSAPFLLRGVQEFLIACRNCLLSASVPSLPHRVYLSVDNELVDKKPIENGPPDKKHIRILAVHWGEACRLPRSTNEVLLD